MPLQYNMHNMLYDAVQDCQNIKIYFSNSCREKTNQPNKLIKYNYFIFNY